MSKNTEKSGTGEVNESRRNFLRAAPGRLAGLAVLLGGLRDAVAAEAQHTVTAQCGAEAAKVQQGRTPGILSDTCGEKLQNLDEEKYLRLMDALRSAPAFEEGARVLPKILELKNRKCTLLYPAAGSHLGPVMALKELIKQGSIDEGEVICTEISECALVTLKQHLKILVDSVEGFTEPKTDKQKVYEYVDNDKKVVGTETVLTILYKEKPIRIRYMLNCSGSDWFRSDSLPETDVYVSHDGAAANSDGTLFMILQYLNAKPPRPTEKPQVLMVENIDDPTGRQDFDLKLLGEVTVINEAYGHREMSENHFEPISPVTFCEAREKAGDPGSYDKYTREKVDEWEKAGKFPSYSTLGKVGTEVGYARFRSAALLKIHPALYELDPKITTTLIEMASLGKRGMGTDGQISVDRQRVADTDKGMFEGGTNLCSLTFLKEAIVNMPAALSALQSIDPRLAMGAACRSLQAFTYLISKCNGIDLDWALKDDPQLLTKVDAFLALLTSYVPKTDPQFKQFDKAADQVVAAWKKTAREYKNFKKLSAEKQESNSMRVWDVTYKLTNTTLVPTRESLNELGTTFLQ